LAIRQHDDPEATREVQGLVSALIHEHGFGTFEFIQEYLTGMIRRSPNRKIWVAELRHELDAIEAEGAVNAV